MAAALALTVAAALPAEARSPTRAKCFPPESKTLVHSKETRVYLERGEQPPDTVACNYDTGRRLPLSDTSEGIKVFPPPAIDLAGVLVGFVENDNSDPTGSGLIRIRVLSVRSGREKNLPSAVDPARPDGKVGRLQITRRGSVAWIVCEYPEPSSGDSSPECVRPGLEARVWRLERGSPAELLDEGTDIDPRSLGLRGSSLTWLRGGQRQAATLE